MAWEIELKAAVADHGALRRRLTAWGRPGAAYHKADLYFTRAGEEETGLTAFRLRREKDSWTVTHKVKTVDAAGLEQSLETEFQVDDPGAFESFARALGYAPALRKEKRGQAWERAGAADSSLAPEIRLKAELSEVTGLGWYLEIEALVDEAAPDEVQAHARQAVFETLEILEIQESAIEARPYTQMLREKRFYH